MPDTIGTRARDALFSPDRAGNISSRLRGRRWEVFCDRFPGLQDMRVLDLGGDWQNWSSLTVRPLTVTTVNLGPQHPEVDWIQHVVADACHLSPALLDGRFDLVYSNSLIEHVGGPYRRKELAQIIHGAAPLHWIQTPARSFPIEPHWLFPAFQFFPLSARARISRAWPFGHIKTEGTFDEAIEDALGVDLLSSAEMRHLFPHSDLYHERFAGLTKSVAAVR